jgi:chemotaxis protein methyltransferase CheR
MTVSTRQFESLRKLVYDHVGVVLETDREYLVKSMVEPVLCQWKCDNLHQLMELIHQNPAGPVARQVVELLVTNETYFFRDPAFYEALEKQIIPALIRKNIQQHKLRIWCAACSSGQEPYSLVMLLKEKFPFVFDWDFQLIASDFSGIMLDRAREGVYSPVEVQRGLSADYQEKYMVKVQGGWQVREDVRRAIEFRDLNLKDQWPAEERIDLLLMRNVLIYFEVDLKKKILLKARRSLDPEGYLMLGSSETALFLGGTFESVPFNNNVTGYQLRRLTMEPQEIKKESIERLFNDLWGSVLGLKIEETGSLNGVAGNEFTTWIRIIGTQNLVVLLRCHERLAQKAASIMFGVEPEQARPDQVSDSMKELVNILGGNLKGMLVKYHFLSMPSVSALGEEPHFVGGDPIYESSFLCDNDPLKLTVLRMD